jgi:hypothetical protein
MKWNITTSLLPRQRSKQVDGGTSGQGLSPSCLTQPYPSVTATATDLMSTKETGLGVLPVYPVDLPRFCADLDAAVNVGFELLRADSSNMAVTSSAIVEHFDVVEDVRLCSPTTEREAVAGSGQHYPWKFATAIATEDIPAWPDRETRRVAAGTFLTRKADCPFVHTYLASVKHSRIRGVIDRLAWAPAQAPRRIRNPRRRLLTSTPHPLFTTRDC